MCDVLDRAENRGEQRGMQKGMQKGMEKGMQKGMAKGRLNALMELVLDGMLSCAEAAGRVNLTEQEFLQKMEAYRQTYQSGRSSPLPQ